MKILQPETQSGLDAGGIVNQFRDDVTEITRVGDRHYLVGNVSHCQELFNILTGRIDDTKRVVSHGRSRIYVPKTLKWPDHAMTINM